MLLRFAFENVRSFKEKCELSMLANSQRTLGESLLRENSLRVLPSAVIYGANANGKSNLIKAVRMMQEIVVNGTVQPITHLLKTLELYPFFYSDKEKPMSFEMEFIHNQNRYCYKLSIMVQIGHMGDREIVSESLDIFLKNGKVNVFSRENNNVDIDNQKKLKDFFSVDDKVLVSLNENIDKHDLFLSRGFKSSVCAHMAEEVIDFFVNHIQILDADSVNRVVNISNESFDSGTLYSNKAITKFIERADYGKQQVGIKKVDGDTSMKFFSVYPMKEKNIVIPSEFMESKGTIGLMEFVALFDQLFDKSITFLIDEFDHSIHSNIIKGIIKIFNRPEINKSNSQLIFTTHNAAYLNKDLLRRDQILFIDRTTDTFESSLYSLADFGSIHVRNDENYFINYYKGKYGAIPSLDFEDILMDITANE